MKQSSLFAEHPGRADIPLPILAAIVTLYFGLTVVSFWLRRLYRP